jgi:hypothetical protein
VLTTGVFRISERLARCTDAVTPDDPDGEPEAARPSLDEVLRLLTGPVDGLTDDEVIEAVKEAERIRSASRERTGRLLAELNARGLSWPAIARVTGIKQTTAYDWSRPHLEYPE